jgi:predicted Fe-Mo cluster-binding NifX family protein
MTVPASTGSRMFQLQEEDCMKIAIPVVDGNLSAHFGHCETFALIDVDPQAKKIIARQDFPSPEHQPGLLPAWLAEQGANMIISGGMGPQAQQLFAQNNIEVILGAPEAEPTRVVEDYLAGRLATGDNTCDH